MRRAGIVELDLPFFSRSDRRLALLATRLDWLSLLAARHFSM